MKSLTLLLVLGSLLGGCDARKADAAADLVRLLPDGNLLADIGLARLELDPTARDPLTGLGACSDLLTYCFEEGGKTLDACVGAVRRCSTNAPWNEEPCCPEACVTRYQGARGTAEPRAAFDAALYQNGSCYPGVKELVP